jgi:hypothetical protein
MVDDGRCSTVKSNGEVSAAMQDGSEYWTTSAQAGRDERTGPQRLGLQATIANNLWTTLRVTAQTITVNGGSSMA